MKDRSKVGHTVETAKTQYETDQNNCNLLLEVFSL